MNVTDEMIEKGATAAFQQIENGAYVRAHLRTAFEAALADVPEPHTCSAIDKLEDMQAVIDAERVRIAELEAQLAEGADTVMARAQTAAEEIGRQLSYAKRADTAEAQLAKVREAIEEWEHDARSLNVVPCLPASTLMDCREQILAIIR